MKKGIFTVLIAIFSMSLFAQIDINTPVLVAPTDDKTNRMPDVTLDWNPVSGIGDVNYSIQLSEDSLFTTFESFITGFSSIDMENIEFGTEFFWRVQASDDIGAGDWSEVFSFETFSSLTLFNPTNEATDQNPDVLLKWKKDVGSGATLNGISGVDNFDYQVSFDSLFTNIVNTGTISSEGFDTELYYFVNASLLPFAETYYWRIRATHAMDESDWTDAWSFSTLATLTLTSPADEATNQNLDVELKWAEVTGIFDYVYQFCINPDFNGAITSISDTNAVSPIGLQFGTTYYWRAAAMHTVDTTDWTEARSFEIINTVFLTSPADGDNTDRTVDFIWEAISGISGYELQFDISDTFETAEIYDAIDTSYFQTIFPLDLGSTYFWRVRAFENGDTTNWSNTRSFLVNPDAVNDIYFADNINIYPNPSSDYINIDLEANQQSEVEVRIIDLAGKSIYNNTFSFEQGFTTKTIDLINFNDGIYLIEVNIDQVKYTGKVIIKK